MPRRIRTDSTYSCAISRRKASSSTPNNPLSVATVQRRAICGSGVKRIWRTSLGPTGILCTLSKRWYFTWRITRSGIPVLCAIAGTSVATLRMRSYAALRCKFRRRLTPRASRLKLRSDQVYILTFRREKTETALC